MTNLENIQKAQAVLKRITDHDYGFHQEARIAHCGKRWPTTEKEAADKGATCSFLYWLALSPEGKEMGMGKVFESQPSYGEPIEVLFARATGITVKKAEKVKKEFSLSRLRLRLHRLETDTIVSPRAINDVRRWVERGMRRYEQGIAGRLCTGRFNKFSNVNYGLSLQPYKLLDAYVDLARSLDDADIRQNMPGIYETPQKNPFIFALDNIDVFLSYENNVRSPSTTLAFKKYRDNAFIVIEREEIE